MRLAVYRVFSFLLFFLCSFAAFSQNLGNSPYSIYGIGDVIPLGGARNFMTGGTGIASSSPSFINQINPALLSRTRFATFEAGGFFQAKRISTEESSQRDAGGNLEYLALSFPTYKWWRTAIGFQPYSYVNYDISFTDKVINDTVDVLYSYTGRGGISQVYLSNGFNLGYGFSVGIHAGYLFGSADRTSFSQLLTGDLGSLKNGTDQITKYKGFGLKAGIAWRKKLEEGKEDTKSRFLNVGFVYDFASTLRQDRSLVIETRDLFDEVQSSDTLYLGQKGNLRLPAAYRAGIGLEQPGKWGAYADFSLENWSAYRNDFSDDVLGNAYTIALGGEYTPNFTAVRGYWKRVTYRAGFNYKQTPLVINGSRVNAAEGTLGLSMPVGRSAYNILNLGFVFGQRGSTLNGLIQEQYFRIHFGITLNDPLWFLKPKIN